MIKHGVNNRYTRKIVLGFTHPLLFIQRFQYDAFRSLADGLCYLGFYNNLPRVIFVAGMALSGSTWINNLLARVPGVFTRTTPMPKDVAYRQDICDSAFNRFPKRGHTLLKTHLNPSRENIDCIFRNGVDKVLVTYRDLRDVVVSHYYRLTEFPKDKNAFDYKDYNALGKEKAIDILIDHTATYFIPWIRGWIEESKKQPERFYFIKFEELKRDPKDAFRNVLNFYGINLSDSKIDRIIEAAKGRGKMKDNLKKARILPAGYVSNFRSGKIGQWREEFTENQIEKCRELLGAALIELGYEKDLRWGLNER